ncbi:MAG: hypothetical protein J6V02_08080 [Bacteroidaceae bacterium]|nr:hypothetical protein [Bacteroidaceae bacterium]
MDLLITSLLSMSSELIVVVDTGSSIGSGSPAGSGSSTGSGSPAGACSSAIFTDSC